MTQVGLSAKRLTVAAADLADEIGFGDVTMTALAHRFEVQVASLYAHVQNVGDLRTRVALLALADLADRVAEAVAGRSGRDAVAALGNAYREFAQLHPGRCEATRLPLDPDTAAHSDGVQIAALMRAALRDYHLGPADETHAVRIVGSVLHGFVALELAGGFEHSDPGSAASWDRAIDALDTAFRHWPTTTETVIRPVQGEPT